MKRFFIILLILATLLTACGVDSEPVTELWVVTELDEEGMNPQAEMLIDRFEAEHPGITVRLDILPGGEESRAAYLQKIRTEVMSGGGPDVYLMPTAAQSPPSDEIISTPYLEPLYPDVTRQMYNGIFADISKYYNADTELHTDELVTAVMDAGIMDGARYVLPLRYSFDLILVDVDALEEMGLNASGLEGGLDELYRFALDSRNEYIAHALKITPCQALLEEFIDHLSNNVLMKAEDVERLIDLWNAVEELENIEMHADIQEYYNGIGWVVTEPGYPDYACSTSHYIKTNRAIFANSGYPLFPSTLSECVDFSAAIKQSGENVAMYPIRAVGGDLVAEVVYYGAVGIGCEDPELAYEFLRLFLTQEIQWEQYSPRNQSHSSGNVYDGFPVRAHGAAEPLYENMRRRLDRAQKQDHRMKNYPRMDRRALFLDDSFTISDEDIPVLSVPIDRAIFPVSNAGGDAFDQHIPLLKTTDNLPGILNSIIEDLQWTLGES